MGVHDPLSARVVVFGHGNGRLALVSLDNIGFYGGAGDDLRQGILEACDLEPAELFLCAIHTHSAPSLVVDVSRGHSNNVEYTRSLRGKLIALVGEALERQRPVEVGFGAGASPVGANRRETVRDASGSLRVVLGRNPAVATDREVQVVSVRPRSGGEPLGVLFAYATHSTSLGPANYWISGDVHGLAEQCVERHLGAGVIVPAFAGASGDIDPWYRVLPGFRTTNGWLPEPELMGTMLGEEVVHTLQRISGSSANGPVRTVLKTIQLPGKVGDEDEGAPARAFRPFQLSVARVGEVAFVGLGGEVFNEIGRTIKASSPFPCTMVITHCNGAAGYVPTHSSYAEGGYEVRSSPFAPGAAEMLIEEVGRLLAELKRS